jgi:hypothetical protein
MWSPNNSSRGGTKVDLFLLHTQEGDGNADSLAKYLQGNQVSYHYTISEDPTTTASPSSTSSTPTTLLVGPVGQPAVNQPVLRRVKGGMVARRLAQAVRAIDVAAYLAVQDCKKYGIPSWSTPAVQAARRASPTTTTSRRC